MPTVNYVHYDTIILGTGPSVWAAAIAAASCSLRVMTIERDIKIPECANTGSVSTVWDQLDRDDMDPELAAIEMNRVGVERCHNLAQFVSPNKMRIWDNLGQSFFVSADAILVPKPMQRVLEKRSSRIRNVVLFPRRFNTQSGVSPV